MNWYDRHILPWLIDTACGLPMVQTRRQALVPQARGRVLEIGIGTGRNLPFYDLSRLTQLVGVDPALQMHPLARRRSDKVGLAVELVGLSAERLPLPDDSFDTVVCTYTLCSIPDPGAALHEVRRVLKPGGTFSFVSMVARPTRGWPAGRTGCSPCGRRWPVVVISTGMCRCCCARQD